MQASSISTESILMQLGKVLASSGFEGAGRSCALLKFVVEQTVSNQGDRLKEYTLGVEALGRPESFDPRVDPIVRAEASRLRSRLDVYYATEGRDDMVRILLPKGGYVPQFVESASSPATNVAELRRPGRLGWLIAGVVAMVFAGGLGVWTQMRSRPSPLVQFDVELKARGWVGSEVGTHVILSPDGTRLVYVSLSGDGVSRLNTRRLAEPQATELPGTEGARDPFFSPDGRWVGFEAAAKLKKTPVEGGSPVVLCDAKDATLGASWGDDGYIIASLGEHKLSRISSSGDQPNVVLDLAAESVTPMWPQVLPGSKTVIFTAVGSGGPNEANVEALALSTGKRTVLVHGGTYGRYLPIDYVTYINQGTLFAQPIDLNRLQASGPAAPVLGGVSYSSTYGFAQVDFSQTGALVYQQDSGGEFSAVWFDSSGKLEPYLTKPGRYLWPSLSPDGKRLALSVTESGSTAVQIYRGTDQITKVASPDRPIWTPDGRFLVLGGFSGLSWVRSDGSGAPQKLTGHTQQVPWSFSPDGKRLAYHERSSSTGFDLWTVPVMEASNGLAFGSPEPYLRTEAYETYPAFSGDGRWMAYGSNESGSWQVYVRAFPDNGTKVQVSTAGGRIAHWMPGGRELLYRTDDQRVMIATYTAKGGVFVVQGLRPWPKLRLADTGVLSNFDLSPDGRRILALVPATRPEDQQTENHVTFMLNFFEEIKRKAGSR